MRIVTSNKYPGMLDVLFWAFVVLAVVLFAGAAFAIDSNGPENHGEQITVELPVELHRRNTSSKGLGNCVFTSIHHSAVYQSVPALQEFPKFLIDSGIPGGGYPSKVAELIPQCAKSKALPAPDYVQHTGGNMDFLRMALRTGRLVCVTYAGSDGVYYSGPISHMVNLVHLSESWAVILDNNYPGKYLWMTPGQFEQRWKARDGGWAIVLLAPPPPPIPINRPQQVENENVNALTLTALLASAPPQFAPAPQNCPNNQCPAPQRVLPQQQIFPQVIQPQFVPQIQAAPAIRQPMPKGDGPHGWHLIDGSGGKLALYWRGERCGELDPRTAVWLTDGKDKPVDLFEAFGLERNEKAAPGPKAGELVEIFADTPGPEPFAEDPFPGGVAKGKVPQHESYDCSGRECTKSQAFQALASAGLVDDRDRFFLTIVGPQAMRSRVLKDLDAEQLASLRTRIHVNDYDPSSWAVKQIGLPQGVFLQGPPDKEGKSPILWRFPDYTGAVALAEAIRKSDPNYRPDADPDPSKKPADPAKPNNRKEGEGRQCNQPVGWLLIVVMGLVGVAAVFALRRK